MPKIAEIAIEGGGQGFVFFCPGCKYYHSFQVKLGSDSTRPIWEWNGDLDKPTFSPSLLVNGFSASTRCHTFVRDGQILYLSDCFHWLRERTIDMQEIEW